jgi:hypothetical protein
MLKASSDAFAIVMGMIKGLFFIDTIAFVGLLLLLLPAPPLATRRFEKLTAASSPSRTSRRSPTP